MESEKTKRHIRDVDLILMNHAAYNNHIISIKDLLKSFVKYIIYYLPYLIAFFIFFISQVILTCRNVENDSSWVNILYTTFSTVDTLSLIISLLLSEVIQRHISKDSSTNYTLFLWFVVSLSLIFYMAFQLTNPTNVFYSSIIYINAILGFATLVFIGIGAEKSIL